MHVLRYNKTKRLFLQFDKKYINFCELYKTNVCKPNIIEAILNYVTFWIVKNSLNCNASCN